MRESSRIARDGTDDEKRKERKKGENRENAPVSRRRKDSHLITRKGGDVNLAGRDTDAPRLPRASHVSPLDRNHPGDPSCSPRPCPLPSSLPSPLSLSSLSPLPLSLSLHLSLPLPLSLSLSLPLPLPFPYPVSDPHLSYSHFLEPPSEFCTEMRNFEKLLSYTEFNFFTKHVHYKK